MNIDRYRARFPSLTFEEPSEGILEVVLNSDSGINSMDAEMHRDIAYVWRDIDMDESVQAVLIRGEGKGFSAGGDFNLIKDMIDSDQTLLKIWKESKDLVYNIINCSKPVISAIHGPAVGAGLTIALLADISVAAKDARLIDSHTSLGVAAGDLAAMIWPLLCGMAKAKYHLLTGKPVSGEEAERIGLVSLCVDADSLCEISLDVARNVASGSPSATRWTKHALNGWLRVMGPNFDHSLALEMWGFRLADSREGVSAAKEKRQADFDQNCPI